MKKMLFSFFIGILFLLSGCVSVYIEPDTVNLYFENIEYDETGVQYTMDIQITNGYDTDLDINTLMIDLYTSDDEYIICAADFDLNTTIPADGYYEGTITFYSDSFQSDPDLLVADPYNYDMEDVILYFDFS